MEQNSRNTVTSEQMEAIRTSAQERFPLGTMAFLHEQMRLYAEFEHGRIIDGTWVEIPETPPKPLQISEKGSESA